MTRRSLLRFGGMVESYKKPWMVAKSKSNATVQKPGSLSDSIPQWKYAPTNRAVSTVGLKVARVSDSIPQRKCQPTFWFHRFHFVVRNRISRTSQGGDEFTVDSIKTYEVSQVKDVSKHAPCHAFESFRRIQKWGLSKVVVFLLVSFGKPARKRGSAKKTCIPKGFLPSAWHFQPGNQLDFPT